MVCKRSECNNNTGICRKSADFYNLALNFYRYKTFVIFKSVTFEIFRKCSEGVNFDANNDLQEDLKIFKSDTFENYKTFVPVEVQSDGI